MPRGNVFVEVSSSSQICRYILGRPDFFAPHLATIFWTPLRYKIGEPEGKSPIHAFSVPAGGLKFRF